MITRNVDSREWLRMRVLPPNVPMQATWGKYMAVTLGDDLPTDTDWRTAEADPDLPGVLRVMAGPGSSLTFQRWTYYTVSSRLDTGATSEMPVIRDTMYVK